MWQTFLGLYNYWIVILLMMAGFYIVMTRHNLVKKLIGLNIFQSAVFLFYISVGKVKGGTAPIVEQGISSYSNPLPHVLDPYGHRRRRRDRLARAGAGRPAQGGLRHHRGRRNQRDGRRRLMGEHLPILQVILPLIAAPVCLLVRHGTCSAG